MPGQSAISFPFQTLSTEAHSSSERPEAKSAALHKASVWSEFASQNQPAQYAPSILSLQVVLAHIQMLNESRLQWGRSSVPGHRAEKHSNRGLPVTAAKTTNAVTSKQTLKDEGSKATQGSSPSRQQRRRVLCRSKTVENCCQVISPLAHPWC